MTRLVVRIGQVYYTLLKAREDRGIKDIAISRLEQISPFPYELLTPHLDKYPNADILYCQASPYSSKYAHNQTPTNHQPLTHRRSPSTPDLGHTSPHVSERPRTRHNTTREHIPSTLVGTRRVQSRREARTSTRRRLSGT